jgi:hypothetical protein
MTGSNIAELRKKNDDLLQLVLRLVTIIFRNAVEQRELAGVRGSTIAPRLLAATMPVGIVEHLREVALRCGEISRASCDPAVAHELEGLSVELAAEAETLEGLLGSRR